MDSIPGFLKIVFFIFFIALIYVLKFVEQIKNFDNKPKTHFLIYFSLHTPTHAEMSSEREILIFMLQHKLIIINSPLCYALHYGKHYLNGQFVFLTNPQNLLQT